MQLALFRDLIRDPTVFLPPALLLVALLAGIMAWLTVRSYQGTGNIKLLFVFIAFVCFVIKSVFLFLNEVSIRHPVGHHTALMLGSLFDVIIVLLLFVPFLAARAR